jgi:MFS family permease
VLLLTSEYFDFSAFELALSLSVLPQLLLALGSPAFGVILDRIGIVRCRVLINILQTASLGSYFVALLAGWPALIYVGSIFQGLSNAGGQLTWFLASSLFAPRTEDVPVYNGIHFVLNGTRGLLLPWVGSVLFVVSGPGAVLTATVISLVSVPILLRALRLKDSRLEQKPLRIHAGNVLNGNGTRETGRPAGNGPLPRTGTAS